MDRESTANKYSTVGPGCEKETAAIKENLIVEKKLLTNAIKIYIIVSAYPPSLCFACLISAGFLFRGIFDEGERFRLYNKGELRNSATIKEYLIVRDEGINRFAGQLVSNTYTFDRIDR